MSGRLSRSPVQVAGLHIGGHSQGDCNHLRPTMAMPAAVQPRPGSAGKRTAVVLRLLFGLPAGVGVPGLTATVVGGLGDRLVRAAAAAFLDAMVASV